MFLDISIYLIFIYIIGLLSFFIFFKIFYFLPDFGWGISKTIGLVLIGSISWIFLYLKWFNLNFILLISILFILLFLSSYLIWKNLALYKEIKKNLKNILLVDLIFLFFFFLALFLKGFDSSISGTEKPMDFMMLNSITFSGTNPPNDAWFGGLSISYYYFGYWLIACTSVITGIANSIIFTLSIPLIVGLSASAIFSIIFLFTKDSKLSTKILCGLIGCLALLISSNLSTIWVLLDIYNFVPENILDWYSGTDYQHIITSNNWRPEDHWWWWNSSRVINTFSSDGVSLDYTIQEFPFFSILIGDLHPHFISIPFVLTSIVCIFSIHKFHIENGAITKFRIFPITLFTGIFIMSVGFINFWDFSILFLLYFLIVFGLWLKSNTKIKNLILDFIFPSTFGFLIGLFVFSGFYFFTSQSQINFPYILPVIYNTRFIHFLTVWGLFIIPVLYLIFLNLNLRVSFCKNKTKALLFSIFVVLIPVLLRLLVLLIFNGEFNGLYLASIFSLTNFFLSIISFLSLYLFLQKVFDGNDVIKQFILGMIFVSFYLIFLAENFYLNDFFGNRMNTVFKFYYQAWILLSIVIGVSVKNIINNTNRYQKLFIYPIIIIFLLSTYFSISTTATKLSLNNEFNIDGAHFLTKTNSDEKEVIDYIAKNLNNNDKIIESYGDSYSDFSRISAFTGIPTIIGWPFHELQWRGSVQDIEDRKNVVDRIFLMNNNPEDVKLLKNYKNYILIIGPRERQKFSNIHVEDFDNFGTRIFQNRSYILFKIK